MIFTVITQNVSTVYVYLHVKFTTHYKNLVNTKFMLHGQGFIVVAQKDTPARCPNGKRPIQITSGGT